jgi:hypothetical protein
MRSAPVPRLLTFLLAGLALALAVHQHRAHAFPPGTVMLQADRDTVRVTAAARAAGLRFAPAVSSGDRAWVLAAIAAARPEARRLIAEVDGLVTVHTGLDEAGVMGLTQSGPAGFAVSLNTAQLDGLRRIDRNVVVLHELGHVIDGALVPRAIDAELDAGIPRGSSCGSSGGPFGACAPAAERFADTFAKWSLGGAVSAVGAGYGIPNPPSLETWGSPLATLAAGLPAA